MQVDQRRRQLSFAPQRIPTAEGQDVTLTFVLTVRVSDPVAFLTAADEPDREVYLATQIALRELVATKPLAEFIGQRIDLSPRRGGRAGGRRGGRHRGAGRCSPQGPLPAARGGRGAEPG